MMLFLLLVTTANALRLADATPRPAMKPVMKLRGGVTGVNPTILAKSVYTLAIVKAVTFSMAPERSAKKLCNTEPSVVGLQTFEDRATVMSMIVTMSLCALWGMPPGKAVAWGWAPYFYTRTRDVITKACFPLTRAYFPSSRVLVSASGWAPYLYTRTRHVLSGGDVLSVMPRRHELKRLFHLLLNAALAVVSYTDLGGKARIAMLVLATFAALDSIVAYTAPAFVLSSGAFGKAADEATDLERSLLKLWGGTMASLAVLTASLALGKSALESVAYSLALQTAVQFESLFVSKKTMASDLKPWYVKMVLSSKSITGDIGMVPLTLVALISLGKL
uniref:Uncharacterized protein n=1 Tax=Phaeocystis antarctica TaxID=33657 RepID=A0A7S0EX83_9EUKA